MTRLIDADALKENLKNLILPNIPEEGEEGNFDNFLSNIILKQAIEDIENAPTVDAVAVVRCEDCRWYDKSTASGTYEPIAFKCILHQRFTLGNMFCSDGEKDDA